jgi:hypothetical protein
MRSLLFLPSLLLTALLSPTTARLHDRPPNNNTTFCQIVQPDLPPECSCQDNTAGPLSFVVACVKVFDDVMLNDTIGIDLTLAPCDAQGSSLSLNLTEQAHGINFRIAGLRAGDETNFPIPGLSALVPGIGSVGVDMAVLIFGNVDALTLEIGLNACAMVHTHEICASAIPGLNRILPWWILQGTYSFGHVCNATNMEAQVVGEDESVGVVQ